MSFSNCFTSFARVFKFSTSFSRVFNFFTNCLQLFHEFSGFDWFSFVFCNRLANQLLTNLLNLVSTCWAFVDQQTEFHSPWLRFSIVSCLLLVSVPSRGLWLCPTVFDCLNMSLKDFHLSFLIPICLQWFSLMLVDLLYVLLIPNGFQSFSLTPICLHWLALFLQSTCWPTVDQLIEPGINMITNR